MRLDVFAFELIGLVRTNFLDGQGELPVVIERAGQICGKSLRYRAADCSVVFFDRPSRHVANLGYAFRISRACDCHGAAFLQEGYDFFGNHDTPLILSGAGGKTR